MVFSTIINSFNSSAQSFISHHILLLKTFSIKTRSPLPSPLPILHFTSPHSTSLCFVHFTLFHFATLQIRYIFTSLYAASLHFSMISSTLYFLLIQLNYYFPCPLFKSDDVDTVFVLLMMGGETTRNM